MYKLENTAIRIDYIRMEELYATMKISCMSEKIYKNLDLYYLYQFILFILIYIIYIKII
jgi:hypothetical protein